MGQIHVTYDLDGIEGLCLIESTIHEDSRGYFMETFSQKDMYEAGLYISFVQDNQSMSSKGVLRGLHFQKRFPQTKLVRVIYGTIYDVAVDLRRDSPTYGKYHGEILTADNRKQYLIPRGFAHGFLVLSDRAEFCYKCDEFYHPDDEGGLAWNDPHIGIEWPDVNGTYPGNASAMGYMLKDATPLILSEKDQKWLGIRETFGL
ncbi:MAG: dTDP-4-dehydrorhamnose 3,5-epimerase [Oscillospiraceae bacterium]|nr:dTDP-4-dehydrorhamnose 3,5-epimerase [Oscillospiraceae bacterium]